MKDLKWTLTDVDRKQYGRKISENVYEFKEYNDFDNDWEEMKIDLDKYTSKEIDDFISPYYKSLEEIKHIYKHEANWIIAECIFEQETGLY